MPLQRQSFARESVIKDPTYGGGYEADARSSAAPGHAAVWSNYRKQEYGANMDALFADDTGAMGGIPLPCNYSIASYQAATAKVIESIKFPVFVSTLGASGDPAGQVGFANATNAIGAMCEICYAGYNSARVDVAQTGSRWTGIENAEIKIIAEHKIFWDYARAIGNPITETPLRKYIYASFLLTYDYHYAMLQEAFTTRSGFPILPETALVPTAPLTTASTVTGYLRSGGAYMREYAACYYLGVNHGKCAVVVNPGSGTVRIPTTAYGHSLVLTGSDVLDGGTATFTGGRLTTLGAVSGAVLFP